MPTLSAPPGAVRSRRDAATHACAAPLPKGPDDAILCPDNALDEKIKLRLQDGHQVWVIQIGPTYKA